MVLTPTPQQAENRHRNTTTSADLVRLSSCRFAPWNYVEKSLPAVILLYYLTRKANETTNWIITPRNNRGGRQWN